MSNRVCPNCGQEYSDTYRKCPFCEEEKAIQKGKPIHRHGGKRLSKKKRSRGAGGVFLSVAVVLIIGVAAAFIWGPQLLDTIGVRVDTQEEVPNTGDDIISVDDPVESPDEPAPPVEGQEGEASEEQPAQPAGPLAISQEAISIPAGESALLSVTGGSGSVKWTSTNDQIASVKDGSVTGKAGGTVTITASSGEESVSCKVTITGDPWVNPVKLSLSLTDFTFGKKDPSVQLKIKGGEYASAVWSSDKPQVASVDQNGLITWKGKGTATITVNVDGQELQCIARAK